MTSIEQFIQVGGALLAVTLLVVALGYVAKRFAGNATNTGNTIEVVATLHLGPRDRLMVIQVEQRQMLIGVGTQQIALLSELPDAAPGRVLANGSGAELS